MAAGEVIENWKLESPDFCQCGRRCEKGEVVTMWSSNWKVGHKKVLYCQGCKAEKQRVGA